MEVNQNKDKCIISRIIFWKPTCRLRWTVKDIPFDMINKEKVLQQMWQGDNDEQEWRDIEFSIT